MANHIAQQEKRWTIISSLLFCVFLLIATSDAHDEMEEYLEFFPTHPVSSPLYKCPPGYTLMDGVNCYKAIATPLTVEDARLECWADGGGSLAFPKHLGENLAIGQLARGAGISRNYWLGYERYETGIKDLVGEDGKMPVGVGEWAINQPSEYGGNCVSADASLDWFSWSFTECDQTLPFICHRCGCVGDEFFCLNGGCVKASYLCDGEDQCGDNSDEMDPSCLVECGGWLSVAGTTTYPATGPYPGSADCWWIIPASPTTDIELLLNYLNTEELCDFLDIYVGGPVQSKARLAKSLSGQHRDLRFTGHGLMLHFTSNAANGGISGQSEGFKFQWTPVNRRNERLVASLSSKTLAGPADGYCNTVFKYYITPDQPHNLITVNVLSDPSGGLMVFRDNYERLLPGYTTSSGEQLTLMFNTGDGTSFDLEYFRGCDFDIISPTTKINIPQVKTNCLAECSWKIVDPNNRRLTWKSTFDVEAEVYENQQTWVAGDGGTTFTQTSSDTGLFVRYKPVSSGLQADVSIGCEPYDTTNFDNTTLNTDFCDTNSLRCQAGYIFDILGKDICMPNLNEWPPGYSKCEFGGIWTPAVIPTCTRVRCGPTPSLDNGFVSSVDSFYYGGIANYTCFDCYERTGDHYICNELGNWVEPSSGSPPRCEMKECSPPNNITNGVVIVTDTNHQCCSVLNYECDEGYALTAGPSAAVCMGDGQYMPSPQPTCKKICCPVPHIANAVSSVAESHVDYNDTVDVTCNAGYMLTDGSTNYTATCQSNGELSKTEPCKDIDECSSPPFPCMPDNTVANCHNYPGGFSCSCEEGYELDADDITCNDITVCDVLPYSCARGNCTDLTGSIYSCSCADPYELFTYNNQQGFQVKPGESGYRKGDVYQIQHTCIPKRCPGTELPVTDESVERIQWSGQTHYEVGAVVELSCNHGYCIGGGDSIFNASYECNADGTWIMPNETCEVCQCTVPPTASSDSATPDVAIGSMRSYGQTVTYSCSSPYHAVTYRAICGYNCDTNKYEFIGGPRECERIDCERPEAPYLISTAGNTLSDHANAMFDFQCDTNYLVNGSTDLNVTCTNGLWDFHGLYCGAQTCPDPGTPDGGSQASDTGGIPSYNVGDTVVFNCALAYQTPVPAQITCQTDLSWSPDTNLTCVDMEAPTCGTETITVGQGDRLDTIKHRPTTVVENSGYYTVAPTDMQIGALFTMNVSVTWNVTDGSGNSVLCTVIYIYPVSVSGCAAFVSIAMCESTSLNLTDAELTSFSPPLQLTTAASANVVLPTGYAPQLYTKERITQDATGFNSDTDQCIYELQYLPAGCDTDVFENHLYPDGVGSCANATSCTISAPNNMGYGICSSEVTFSCVDGAFESKFGSTHNSYPVPARTSFSYNGIIANFTNMDALPEDLTGVMTELDNLAGLFATRCMADYAGVFTIEAGAFADNDLTITKSYSVKGPSATQTASCLGSIRAIISACTTSPHIAALRTELTTLSECTSIDEEGCPATINGLPTSGSFIVSECCCELCPPGTFYDNDKCTECAVGTYSDTEHAANCTACDGSMTTLFPGATSVDYCYESECASPLVQGLTLAEPCETIAADMYWVNSSSSDACDPDTGTSGSSRGTTSTCQAMCAPGNYSCSGLEPCAACPQGFYNNGTGSTNCTQCADDKPYTINTGSLYESDCVEYPSGCEPLDCTGTGAIDTNCTFDITACDCIDGYIGLECEELWIDPCISQPCYNGGACTRGSGDYTCSCPAGTTGTNCVDILTDCDPSPCTNGVCEELVNDYRCHCPEGIFEGDTCTTMVDVCATTNPCLNGGTCVNQAPGSYQCECASGYIGVNCTEDIDVCVAKYGSVFCANGGTCVDGAGFDYSCACVDGFSGFQCVIPPDDVCESIVCSDAGMCYPDHKTSAPTCACLDLYSVDGTTCVPDDNCDTNPCVNDGVCETLPGSYTCNCLAGNEGFHCQQYTDECVSDPCQNGGSCTDLNNPTGYTCSCLYGFTGTDCETNIDDCIMCVNHIDCEDLVGDHVCNCNPGYTGKNCETEIDFCASCPCQHGGTCNPTVNQYTCTCAAGWVGDDCEDLEDLCASTPCQNDGTCTNVLGGYFCKCKDGILGTHCETQPSTCIIADPCVRGVCMATQLWQQATCTCPDLYEGDSCECIENLCQTDPCLNGGTCDQDELGAYSCQCRTGYAGFNCETDINDCMGVSCGDGVCQDKVGYYVCVCPDGFGGPSCDKPTNRQFDIHLSGATAASRVPIDISGCEELTVGAWVKYTGGVGSSPGTFLTVDYDGGTSLELNEFGLGGGATVNYHSDVDISDHNEWSYVTACISASEIRVSLGTAFSTIGGLPSLGNSLIIKAGSANFFGTVSLIQAWCRCLPELEIQAITNAGNVDTNVADDGLVFDYRQDALNLETAPTTTPSYRGVSRCPFGTLSVNDQCQDLPTIENCPSDIAVKVDSNTQMATASFTQPTSTYPLQTNVMPGDRLGPGTTVVVYNTYDNFGHRSDCKFNIFARLGGCEEPAKPITGSSLCTSGDVYSSCMPKCGSGYDFVWPSPNISTCGALGRYDHFDVDNTFTYPPCGKAECSKTILRMSWEYHLASNQASVQIALVQNYLGPILEAIFSNYTLEVAITAERNTGVSIEAPGVPCDRDDWVPDCPDIDNTEEYINYLSFTAKRFNLENVLGGDQIQNVEVNCEVECTAPYAPNGDCCVECPKGTYYDTPTTSCMHCARGTYQDLPGQFSCKVCPTGFTTKSVGADDVGLCMHNCTAGYRYDGSMCVPCGYGKYQEYIGQDHCHMCPPNYTTVTTKTTNPFGCIAICDYGYQMVPPSIICTPCPVGEYRGPGMINCTRCRQDTSTVGVASIDESHCNVTKCSPGRQMGRAGTCEYCPLDYYREEDMDQCEPCVNMTRTMKVGADRASNCSETCEAGYYLLPNDKCQECPIGTFKGSNQSFARECESCSGSKTTRELASTSPDQCFDVNTSVVVKLCIESGIAKWRPDYGDKIRRMQVFPTLIMKAIQTWIDSNAAVADIFIGGLLATSIVPDTYVTFEAMFNRTNKDPETVLNRELQMLAAGGRFLGESDIILCHNQTEFILSLDVKCHSGEIYNEQTGQCICPKDYYKPEDFLYECLPCPNGYITEGMGKYGPVESVCHDMCHDFCHNGGTCTIEEQIPRCRCPREFDGTRCEIYLAQERDDLIALWVAMPIGVLFILLWCCLGWCKTPRRPRVPAVKHVEPPAEPKVLHHHHHDIIQDVPISVPVPIAPMPQTMGNPAVVFHVDDAPASAAYLTYGDQNEFFSEF